MAIFKNIIKTYRISAEFKLYVDSSMDRINYVSLFSGIEAAKIAFDKAGIDSHPIAFFEIDKKASELLKDKYPDTPNLGNVKEADFRQFKGKINFLCGGSPCQSFSMMNTINRDCSGVDLFHEYQRAVLESEPDMFFYENVPPAADHIAPKCNRNLTTESEVLSDKYHLKFYNINSADMGFVQPRKRFYIIGCKRKFINIKVDKIIDEWAIYKTMIFDYVPPTEYDLKKLNEHLDKLPEGSFMKQSKSNFSWNRHGKALTITCEHPLMEVKKYTYSTNQIEWNKGKLPEKLPTVIATHPIIELDGVSMRIMPPEELEFLQGFPIGYTKGYSASRRVKMIGNSWHVGTVAELFRQMFNNLG